MKLASKINLLFTVIVSCILLGMGIIIYFVSRQRVENEFRQRLESRARSAARLYQVFREDSVSLLRSLDASSPASLFNKNIVIYNNDHIPLYTFRDKDTDDLTPDTTRLMQAKEDGESFYHVGQKEVLLYYFQQEDQLTVLVAAENVIGREYLQNQRNIFFIYFPVALAVTLIAGYLFSKRLVKPVKETIQDVNLITSQNLSHRLYIGNNKDELADLNKTFNDLLNRLEESFNIQKRFIANASHELSTPLTSISSQIEVAMLQERHPEEYRKVLSSVLEDVKGLHQLTRNLLEIAKAGTHGAIQLDKVRLDEVILRTHSEVIRQNPGFRAVLDFPDLPEDENECMVFGNPHLLHIAFKNIIENGCKYSPDKTVNIQFILKGKSAELIFSNKSDVLPDEEIEHIFEPFYRSVNVVTEPGFGLGLTMTKRIIGLHKGTIDVRSGADSGTVVTVVLPTVNK